MEELNDLYLFARVVEAGGLSAAERRTGIPKSRLSRRLAALEARLGVRLIHRSAHRFSVTAVGEDVYRHARAIADEAEAVVTAVSETLGEPSGLVRVSSSPLMGDTLAAWIAAFMTEHPKVKVALELSNRYVDLLAERIDIAIRFSTEPLASTDVVARPIGRTRMAVVASPHLVERLGEPASIEDLNAFPTLGQGTPDAVRPWRFEGAKKGQIVSYLPHPRFVASSFSALREAAVAGVGIVQLPVQTCEASLAAGTLRTVLDAHPSKASTTYAMYPSRRGQTSAVRTLLPFLEARFRDLR
jgi:DNA-binding transcriptional LysR family regulator